MKLWQMAALTAAVMIGMKFTGIATSMIGKIGGAK